MKNFIIALLIVITTFCYGSKFEFLSFEEVPTDNTASLNPTTDDNMHYCIALMIENDDVIDPLFKQKLYNKGKKKGVTYYFFSADDTQFDILVKDYEPITINVKKELGTSLMYGKTYRLRLRSIPEVFAKINITPADALIIIDDKVVPNNQTLSLQPGSHLLKIVKENYHTIEKSFEISNGTYNLELQMNAKDQEVQVVEKVVEKVVTQIKEVPVQVETEVVQTGIETTDNGFKFSLTKITFENSKILISGFITNLEDDRELRIFGSSYIYDNLGKKYEAEKLKLSNFDQYYRDIKGEMIQDLAIPFSMEFKNIKGSPTSLAKFSINYYSNNEKLSTIFKKLSL